MSKTSAQHSPTASTVRGQLNSEDIYLVAGQVRRRYGDVSEMTIWRWLDDPELNFPKPTMIQKRRFWRLADLIAWEATQATKAKVAS